MDRFIKIFRIILLLFALLWLVIWFTARSANKRAYERNYMETMIVDFGTAPDNAMAYLKNGSDHLSRNFKKIPGLKPIGELEDSSCLSNDYYMLHYRITGSNTGEVWLQNIRSGQIAYTWHIPLQEVENDVKQMEKEIARTYGHVNILSHYDNYITGNIRAINIHSPVMTSDSSLIFNVVLGYVYKLDKNSQLVWKSKHLSHHSIELDDQENVWTCSVDLDNPDALKYGYRDDAILCLSQQGEVLHFYSLTNMFQRSGLLETAILSTQSLFEESGYDPFHINDVLPVKQDGPYWKKGDVFFSLRHQSMIALYRPADDSMVWHQKGPWLTQHDINILSDSTISVFNNNAFFTGMLERSSNIARYNFASGETDFLFEGIFDSHSNGRQTLTEDGLLIVEETDRFKYFVISPDGTVNCMFYLPYYSDPGRAQYPGWSGVYKIKAGGFVRQ